MALNKLEVGLLCLLVMCLCILSFLLNVFSQTGQDEFMLTQCNLKVNWEIDGQLLHKSIASSTTTTITLLFSPPLPPLLPQFYCFHHHHLNSTDHNSWRPRCPMDKASDYESGDSRFESWRGRSFFRHNNFFHLPNKLHFCDRWEEALHIFSIEF